MNLTKKAENYEDQTLKWIFLLNNIYKLSKLFNDKQQQQQQNENNNLTINRIFLLAGKKDLKLFYQDEIRNYKKEYSAIKEIHLMIRN